MSLSFPLAALAISGPLFWVKIDWVNRIHINATVYNSAFSSEEIPLIISGSNFGGFFSLDDSRIVLHDVFGGATALNNNGIQTRCADFVQLGIGPMSELTTRFSSSTIAKSYEDNRSGFLSLGLSDFHFRTHTCLPDSVLSLPMRGSWISVFAYGHEMMRYQSFTVSSSTHTIITADSFFAEMVASHLLSNGADLTDDNSLLSFSNCTDHTLVGLPEIQLRFGTPVAGLVVLQPSDYIAINDDSECLMKFDILSRDQTNEMRVNFFAIPGINVRVSQDVIQICDTVL